MCAKGHTCFVQQSPNALTNTYAGSNVHNEGHRKKLYQQPPTSNMQQVVPGFCLAAAGKLSLACRMLSHHARCAHARYAAALYLVAIMLLDTSVSLECLPRSFACGSHDLIMRIA